jgi:hypothetical protein
MAGVDFRPCMLALVLPFAVAESEPDGMSPADGLRCLGESSDLRLGAGLRLARSPDALLDVIFLARGTDDPDAGTTATARQWILRLSDERYPEREKASEFLHGMGVGARVALEEMEQNPDPEIRMRVAFLQSALKSQPALKDLDYGKVLQGIEKIVAGIKEDAALKKLAEGAIRRMGTPTVHDREAWLLRPVFREVVKRDFEGAASLVLEALEGPTSRLWSCGGPNASMPCCITRRRSMETRRLRRVTGRPCWGSRGRARCRKVPA